MSVPIASAAPDPADDPVTARIDQLLADAVQETARLLEADGAMVYLVDPRTGTLRFAHDAGIRNERARAWVSAIELDPGTGLFGTAVARRSVVVTADYPNDPTFRHAEDPDRVVADIGIRSMVVAPLVQGDDVLGALGAFSTRTDAFDAARIALVRSLADHAAAAMANVRLIAALDTSRVELAERAEVERTLREISVHISAATDLAEVLQRAVDEAARLLRADGARIDLIDPGSGLLRWAYASGDLRPDDDVWPPDPDETLDQGVSGQALVTGRPFWTGDYGTDDRFPRGRSASRYVDGQGIRSVMSVPLIGDMGPFGTLTAFTDRAHAWDDSVAPLLEAIATQAAIAITRARLIDELDRSRTAQARRAEAEQALREIAARITALRDPAEILQQVVELASRLVRGDGAILDLLDPATGDLRWAFDDGLSSRFTAEERAQLWISVGVGATGQAVAEDRTIIAADDLAGLFPPSPESTEFYERTGYRSMIVAPITGEDGPLGVIEVYAVRPAAFERSDAALIEALASQAAVAITNARLIAELAASREALARTAEAERALREEAARRADAERTLREIAARVSAILDPTEVLERIVAEAARLLASDGARIDLWDDELGALRWAYTAGDAMAEVPDWGRSGGLKARQAVAGLAYAEQRPVMTPDFLADERFESTPEIEAFVRRAGIRAVVSTPLAGEHGPLGVLSVVSREPGAYADADVETLVGLATHASIAITNAHLMAQLARSRADTERRADAERTLREIAARITAIRDPGDLLQRIADEAHRLLRADGAVIHEFDAQRQVLVAIHDAGISDEERIAVRASLMPIGKGMAGTAVAERRVLSAGDYLTGDFAHVPTADALARQTGIGSIIVAPIVGDEGPLGAIEVYRHERDAFDGIDEATMGGLAEQAAIAITNARLIAELERSQADLARRAETERTLRDITARIAALHDPDELLERVIEDARRLLGTDGAHLTRMDATGTHLIPVVVAGEADAATRDWLLTLEFPLGGGINGLAAQHGTPTWTDDYRADERIPREEDDLVVADRLGIRSMAAAPLRAPGGDVIGTLAVSSSQPRSFGPDDLDLLQGLADQAAIAITNSNLLERLTQEEARFRGLVQTTPDVIWRADVEGRFTFMADAGEALFGYPATELVGQHFGLLTDEASMPLARERFAAAGQDPDTIQRVPLTLVRRDGTRFAAEVSVAGVFEDGRWVGNQGTVRDVSERERLERDLRRSEERYRYLVQNAPDIVWSIDTDARITFLSDATERLTGFRPDELLGQHFGAIVHASSAEVARIDWTQAMSAPSQELRGRINLRHRDGSAVPAEFIAVATLDASGHFGGANGSVRDMRERDRLEQELRSSEERYRFLVDNSPDIVFAVGVEGTFTYISESVRRALGREPGELIGQTFGAVIHYEDPGDQGRLFAAMRADPTLEVLTRMLLKHADGRLVPFEVSAVGARVNGEFIGIHGAARDIGDRERLERDLRESESRYRTLASSSPDLVFATDAEGRYTFLSDRAGSMLGWSIQDAIGRPFLDFVAPGWEAAAVESYRVLVSDPTVVHTARIDFVRGDGRPIPLEINVIGTVDGERVTAIHGVARDVSERERLERELQQSEERYRFLIQNSPDVVFATDAEGRFTFASAAVERMTGFTPDELIGRPLDAVVDESSLATSAERWQALVHEPDRESQANLTLRTKDGRLTHADVRAIGVVVDGRFAGIQGAARDVSDQVRLERELRRQAGELASGEERAHLARELHDSVTQALFSMTLVSRSVEMLLGPDPEAARAQMGQLRELQREALAEMRALIFELRPGNIEQDGLIRALKTHAAALQGRVGLPIVVESDLEARLPLEAEQVLYRVAQEALHNVVKHAAARQVRVDVHRDAAGVRMRIQDDGKGFDPDTVPDGHLGLAGMRARADRLGASFACHSEPGSGTTIEVALAAAALASMEDRARLVDDAARATPAAGSPSIRDG